MVGGVEARGGVGEGEREALLRAWESGCEALCGEVLGWRGD